MELPGSCAPLHQTPACGLFTPALTLSLAAALALTTSMAMTLALDPRGRGGDGGDGGMEGRGPVIPPYIFKASNRAFGLV